MYYCQDANMYEKVTSVISWNCPVADDGRIHMSTIGDDFSETILMYSLSLNQLEL